MSRPRQQATIRRLEGPPRTHRRLHARLLPAQGDAPALEWVEGRPELGDEGPPLLFVHGAFGGAWQWSELFLPLFAARGKLACAVSLRGHGASGGRAALRRTTLADYRDDLARAVAELPEPPVVVAHSLGGLVAQLLLGRAPMRGLVLLASLPPEGMGMVGPRLALTKPMLWLDSLVGSVVLSRGPISSAGRRVMFTDGLDPARATAYANRLTPESPRALLDAHSPGPILSAAVGGVPALVIGGERDRLVGRASTLRTAVYHGAEHQTMDRMGHFLQLDPGAEQVAERVADWLKARGLWRKA